MSKGYIFTLDAFLAVGIIAVGMIIIYSYNPFTPPIEQPQIYAQDTIGLLSSQKISEFNDPFFNGLISLGKIKNTKYTVLDQIGELYYKRGNASVNATIRNILSHVTRNLINEGYGVAFYIDGTKVYFKNSTKSSVGVLVASKTPAVGILNSTNLWGPYLIEVRVWQ